MGIYRNMSLVTNSIHWFFLPSLATRIYKNIVAGQRKVPLILDDLKSLRPWQPRGIRSHGSAEVVQRRSSLSISRMLVVH
jgi:hypothetical protein